MSGAQIVAGLEILLAYVAGHIVGYVEGRLDEKHRQTRR